MDRPRGGGRGDLLLLLRLRLRCVLRLLRKLRLMVLWDMLVLLRC